MEYGFKFMFFLDIRENPRAYVCTVKVAFRRDAKFSEDAAYFIEGGLSGLNQLMGQLVCINDRDSKRFEYGGHG